MDVHPPKNGINRYWSIPIFSPILKVFWGSFFLEEFSHMPWNAGPPLRGSTGRTERYSSDPAPSNTSGDVFRNVIRWWAPVRSCSIECITIITYILNPKPQFSCFFYPACNWVACRPISWSDPLHSSMILNLGKLYISLTWILRP